MRIIQGRSRSGSRGDVIVAHAHNCTVAPRPLSFGRVSQTIELPRVGGPGSGLGGSWRVIVRNDDHNTFDHVARTLARVIPGVTLERGHEIANVIHTSGQAIVYSGPPGAGRALLGAAQGRRTDDGAARAGLRRVRCGLDGSRQAPRSTVLGAVAVAVPVRGRRCGDAIAPPAVWSHQPYSTGTWYQLEWRTRKSVISGPLPVAFPVEVLREGGELLEPVAVVARAVDGVGARAVAQRDRRRPR